MQIYNWDKNRIYFIDKYETIFSISLHNGITIINGESASGKTLMCKRIMDIQKDKNKIAQKYSADNIFIVNDDNIDKLSQQRDKLIIIDRADILLSNKEINIINCDIHNRYLIFARRPLGIKVTPNHFATLVKQGNDIATQYEFNVKGWC